MYSSKLSYTSFSFRTSSRTERTVRPDPKLPQVLPLPCDDEASGERRKRSPEAEDHQRFGRLRSGVTQHAHSLLPRHLRLSGIGGSRAAVQPFGP